MFRKRNDKNVIHASHMRNYMLHAVGSETLQTFTLQLLKKKNSSDISDRHNVPISIHVFAFLLIVEQDI
jgi:hypothetical protein